MAKKNEDGSSPKNIPPKKTGFSGFTLRPTWEEPLLLHLLVFFFGVQISETKPPSYGNSNNNNNNNNNHNHNHNHNNHNNHNNNKRGHHHLLQVPGPPVPGSTSTIFRATKLWVSAKTPWTWTETCVTRRVTGLGMEIPWEPWGNTPPLYHLQINPSPPKKKKQVLLLGCPTQLVRINGQDQWESKPDISHVYEGYI